MQDELADALQMTQDETQSLVGPSTELSQSFPPQDTLGASHFDPGRFSESTTVGVPSPNKAGSSAARPTGPTQAGTPKHSRAPPASAVSAPKTPRTPGGSRPRSDLPLDHLKRIHDLMESTRLDYKRIMDLFYCCSNDLEATEFVCSVMFAPGPQAEEMEEAIRRLLWEPEEDEAIMTGREEDVRDSKDDGNIRKRRDFLKLQKWAYGEPRRFPFDDVQTGH